MLRFRKRGGWIQWFGLAAIPLVIVASFLGLLIGITGLCIGTDHMSGNGPSMTLCLFFCGAIFAPVVLLAALWIIVASLSEKVKSLPVSPPGSIFHPPTAVPA